MQSKHFIILDQVNTTEDQFMQYSPQMSKENIKWNLFNFHSIYNCQDMKTTYCLLMDEWIMDYYSVIKGGNLAICDNMEGPAEYQAKRSKLDRERQILYEYNYMWNIKKKTKRFTDTDQISGYHRQGVVSGRNG